MNSDINQVKECKGKTKTKGDRPFKLVATVKFDFRCLSLVTRLLKFKFMIINELQLYILSRMASHLTDVKNVLVCNYRLSII